MRGHFFKPKCKCKDKKKCSCGATWYYQVEHENYKNPLTGENIPIKKGGFRTKKEAEIACNLVITELEEGAYIKETNITFEEFADQWLQDYEDEGKVKAGTIRIRKHQIGRLKPYFAKLKLKNITGKQYKDALLDLKKSGLAFNTLDGIHTAGRMVFTAAFTQYLIKRDPTYKVSAPKDRATVEQLEKEKGEVKYLEKEELALFLQTAKEKGLDKDYAVFMLLAYTGMRVGEALALKWKDIDFEEGTVRIYKTLYNPNNNIPEYKLEPPKNITSNRKISVDNAVLEVLKVHQSRQKIQKMKHRQEWHDQDFIFTHEFKFFGYPDLEKTILNRMRRLLKLANLNTDLTPHSLRHTHTSLLAEAGVTLPMIMERLGHKDEETTKWVYMHTTKAMKKEASQKFSELMRSLS